MSVYCQGLKGFKEDKMNQTPIRIAINKGCKFTSVLLLNSVISGLKRPATFTYHDEMFSGSEGNWSGVYGDIIHNRSDISGNYNSVNLFRFKLMKLSPLIGYSNRISILSGKISDNSLKSSNAFESFPLEFWSIFGSLLVVVAIISEILHFNSYPSLVRTFNTYFALIMKLLGQSQKYFTRICCIKHIVMNTTTLISITLMTLFLNTKLSSNQIHHSILRIDSMDELIQFLLKYPHVKLVSDNSITSWPLIMNWQGDHSELIRTKLSSVPSTLYDYSDVYNGKTIIIGYDILFHDVINVNSHLKFHISRDRHYGSQLVLSYSKSINKDLKYKVDSICNSLYESGMFSSYQQIKRRLKRLNIIDSDHPDENISIDFIVTRIRFFILCFISLVILLIIEITLAAYNY